LGIDGAGSRMTVNGWEYPNSFIYLIKAMQKKMCSTKPCINASTASHHTTDDVKRVKLWPSNQRCAGPSRPSPCKQPFCSAPPTPSFCNKPPSTTVNPKNFVFII
jgi:hypothetical protein